MTSTSTTKGRLVLLNVTDLTVITLGSPTGIKSEGSGAHEPLRRAAKASGVPLNTLRSNREPGTPYFGAIPHDVYCHIVHCALQFAAVHECT